jgi:hypothetical protein
LGVAAVALTLGVAALTMSASGPAGASQRKPPPTTTTSKPKPKPPPTTTTTTKPKPPPPPPAVNHTLFQFVLSLGGLTAYGSNTDMSETVELSSAGAGEILKVHSAYNQAKGIEGTAMEEDTGLLGANTPAAHALESQSIVTGGVDYTRPYGTGSWTATKLPASSLGLQAAGEQLLNLIGTNPITVTSATKTATTYHASFTTNELGLLESMGSQGTQLVQGMSASQKALLQGVSVSVLSLDITLDQLARVSSVSLDAITSETPADAQARGAPITPSGAFGTMQMTVSYIYGGTLQITKPTASQIASSNTSTRGGVS